MLMAAFNVVAAFDDIRTANRAVHRLEESGVQRSNVHVLRPGAKKHAGGPVNGLFVGTLIGGLVGLVAGVLWAFFGTGGFGETGRALIVFVPFVMLGTVVGAIADGVFKPRAQASVHPIRREDPAPAGNRDTIVAVHVNDPDAAERAQHVLEDLGAERVDAVTADGTPLSPERERRRRGRRRARD